MGMTTASEKEYAGAVRSLFPSGEYWDKQFADSESDANLFCQAKTNEIIHLRKRMIDLLAESDYKTAVETIGDWERVLLGYTNNNLPLEERRNILSLRENQGVNQTIIKNTAQKYGLTVTNIIFPFKPSFFGFSRFGVSVFSKPAFFSIFYIITVFDDNVLQTLAKARVKRLLKNASFGQGCFGIGQFLGRSYFIKDYASRVFSGIKTLEKFEREVNDKLLSGSIAYFLYNF